MAVDAFSSLALFDGIYSAVHSLQTEIVIFFIAILFHTVFFGKYRIKNHKLANLPKRIPKVDSGKQGNTSPTRPARSPYVAAAERICKAGCSVEVAASRLESELKAVPRQELAKTFAQMIEGVGRNATAEFLAAVRITISKADQQLSVALGEHLLRNYLGLRLKDEFESVLRDLELSHVVADHTRPALAVLALRGALRWGDFEAAMSRLDKACSLWHSDKDVTPSAAPQAVLQHLAKLAAQNGKLPALVEKLRTLGLLAEGLNVVLAECAQCGDLPMIKEVEQLGRAHGIKFTDAAYGSLLRVAQSPKEAQCIFDEAVNRGASGKDLLQSASEWAHKHSDSALAGAVLKNLPSEPTAEVTQSLLRFYGPGGPGAAKDSHSQVLKLYMQHFSSVDLSPSSERMVAEAALQCRRKEVLTQLLVAMTENARKVSLIKSFGNEKRLQDALAVFWACPEKNTCLYNSAMDVCVECYDNSAAQKVMDEATRNGLADIVTHNTIIKAHLQGGDLRRARLAVKDMQKSGLQPNCVTFNEILDGTIKINPEEIWKIIGEMKAAKVKPNHITCSILLKSINANSGKSNAVDRILALLDEMEDEMDEVLLSSMVEACIRAGRADLLVSQLQRQRTSKRIQVKGPHTYGSIIRAYGFVQDLAGVWDTWREMRTRHVLPTSVTLGCMVEALVTNGDVEAGYELICEMNNDKQCAPLVNAIIYCSVLKGFSHQKRFDRMWSVYQEMLSMKIQFSIVTFNTLVDACARSGDMERIPPLLKDMVAQGIQINIITYSAILKGYCQANRLEEAFELVEDMKKSTKLEPDEIMYNTLLDGCARQGLYERGISLLEQMQAGGIKPTNFTLSVLVKLANRGKRLDRAFALCEEISEKYSFRLNVHVYGNLVQACIAHKDVDRAFDVLERMVKERIRPDARVYSMLLRAAVAAGQAKDAAGLVRAAMGLPNPHARLASFDSRAFRPHGGLQTNLLSEILEGIADQCRDERLAVALLQDLRSIANIKFDREMQLRLTTRALND